MITQLEKLKHIYNEIETLAKQLNNISFYKPELEEQLKEINEYRYLLKIVINNIHSYEKENLDEIINELFLTLKKIIQSIEQEID